VCVLRGKIRVKSENEHWYKHVPKLVERIPEGKVTLVWNQQVRTDRTIPNNKADIIIGDNENRNMYVKICHWCCVHIRIPIYLL